VQRHRSNFQFGVRRSSGRHREEGIVIALVAAFMLVVIGAMMALSIDVVTFYTARSEAQLAADSAALTAARVLANSGLTSTNGSPGPAGAEILATAVAKQVAAGNMVGGRALTNAEVTVSFNDTAPGFATDPHVTVTVKRVDLPTFFARILGRTQVTVAASATAEAYNPSPPNSTSTSGGTPPVAPLCVKPWLLPNIDPTQPLSSGTPIFDAGTGFIENPLLIGLGWPNLNPGGNPDGLYSLCAPDCSGAIATPRPGGYYPGALDGADFPAPSVQPACASGLNTYQMAITGCVQNPIVCGANSGINIDATVYAPHNAAGRDADTVEASECLIHYSNPGDSDSIDPAILPGDPFRFLAGAQNPIASAVGQDVVVSDSLVTIPVINFPPGTPPPNTPVVVVGFLQVFLNPLATTPLPVTGPAPSSYELPAEIINMVGCGADRTGQPILGNGASPVAVRLITPP
jgi:hypothetical protein